MNLKSLLKIGKKRKSLANMLTRRIILNLIISMGFTSYLVYEIVVKVIEEEEIGQYEEILDNTNQQIRRVMSDVYVGTVNHIDEIEENLDQPEKMYDIMKRIVERNPRIRSCGISFIDTYYPKKGRWFAPYAVREKDSTIVTRNIGGPNYDYLNSEWFKKGKESKEGTWSKPFFEENDSIVPLVSCMAPIHNKKGEVVAVLGADLSLGWLSNKLQNTIERTDRKKGLNDNIYCFIIDQKGTYIVHPDIKRILRDNYFTHAKETADTLDDHAGKMMVTNERGVYYQNDEEKELTINGTSSCLFYHAIDYTDWSVGMVVPMFDIRIIGYAFGIILLIIIFIGVLVIYLIGRFSIRRTIKPLKRLTITADEVAKGNFGTKLPEIKQNTEIRTLRDSFEKMQHSLIRYVEDLKTTTAQNAAIENELKIASDIQMSMLPKTFPPYPERQDIDIFGMLKPAKEVGGDLFDFYIRDEKLFFCIGDVSGKGVPASLVMAVTRFLFRNVSAHTSQPNHIITAINEALSESNETGMFVTCFVGVLDLTTGNLEYCNAGHESPILMGRGVGQLPCDPNLPLGVMSGWTFTQQKALIDPMTTIFLYTDGLNEAENIDHEQFGDEQIIQLSEQFLAGGETKPETLIKHMLDAVRTFVADAEQSDDLTMLAIQYIK